jgi:hypothetical protein
VCLAVTLTKDPYGGAMVKLRHQQPSLWNLGLAEEIEDLWEPWMRLQSS